MKFLFRVPL